MAASSRPSVRPASEEDIPVLARMLVRLKTLNEELDSSFRVSRGAEEAAEKYLRDSLARDAVRVLVAEVDGDPVGFIRFEVVDRVFYEPRFKAVITDVYVKPAFRRLGIGRLLVEAAAEEAKRMGAGMITAVFPEGNMIARKFYEELGFKVLQVEVFRRL
jgi:ribosomal protein S18 acetylase RimI-like enzyme